MDLENLIDLDRQQSVASLEGSTVQQCPWRGAWHMMQMLCGVNEDICELWIVLDIYIYTL